VNSNDYIGFFKQSPAMSLVMNTNFKIVTVTDNYLKVNMTERKTIIGINVFDVFPDNPEELIP
jgi:hypothetical protein